jgi:hypothetical protein
MASEFDAAEMLRIYGEASEKVYHETLGINPLATMWVECDSAGLLAVAAHVRSATLREAAGVCEEISRRHNAEWELDYEPLDEGMSMGAEECEEALNMLAAAPGERDGGK